MEQQKAAINNMFSFLQTGLSGGLVDDVKTAVLSLGGLLLMLVALDLILKIIRGVAPSEAIHDWWDKSSDEQSYKEYKKRRQKKDDFAARYEAERIGKNDAEAGIRSLQKARKRNNF